MLYFNKDHKISIETTKKDKYYVYCGIIDLCWDWKDSNEFIKVVEWLIVEKLDRSATIGMLMENVFLSGYISKASKSHDVKFMMQLENLNCDNENNRINTAKMNEEYYFLLDLTKVELVLDFLIENKIFLKAPKRQEDAKALMDMLPTSARLFAMETVSFCQLTDAEREATGQTKSELVCHRLNQLKSIVKDNWHPLYDSYGIRFISIVKKISKWLLMMTEFLDTTQLGDDFKQRCIALTQQKDPFQTTSFSQVYGNTECSQLISDILMLCLKHKE